LYSCQKSQNIEWPEINQETKPWVRWWWMGSAVDQEGLTSNMEDLKSAGIGGMEITAIYGVKGNEEKFIDYLSLEWMGMLDFTLNEAERLDLGIDMANASGWPFGGPWINENLVSKNVWYKKYELNEGEKLSEPVVFIQEPLVRAVGHRVDISEVKYPVNINTNLKDLALDQIRFEKHLPIQVLMAYEKKGEVLDLSNKVDLNGSLDWIVPPGNWQLYAVFQGWHGKQVERAGPGGEGNVIDHFSEEAIKEFLNQFDEATKKIDVSRIRAFFNDSYEVDDAMGESNWTPLFLEEFQKERGYDLCNHLPALFGDDTEQKNSRVRSDYRETISDLLLEKFTNTWADWAKNNQALIRNQAHDSPANILDLYAASGIPETEGTDPLGIKFASSAGNVSGKRLISCEAATWLDEHFISNLADLKQNVDRYFVNGVNHIVYHGTPYSPDDAQWPGWMFYASTHLAPTNSLWDDFSTVNNYVANCQSFLQDSKPANDILVYFPIYDYWSEEGRESIRHFEENARETPVKEIGEFLLKKGYTFDFISDRQIANLKNNRDKIISSEASYKTILIPECKYMPLETVEKLIELAENGASIIFQNKIPQDVPGLYDLENRQKFYQNWVESLKFENNKCRIGNGELLAGEGLEEFFVELGIKREFMVDSGLQFIRKKREEGICYFVCNWTENKIDGWVNVNANGKEAVLFDPMNKKAGKAKIKVSVKVGSQVYLQLEKGETRILQFYQNRADIAEFPVWEESGEIVSIDGEWEISFLKGGPESFSPFKIKDFKSWSEIEGIEEFSGTASYKTIFKKPNVPGQTYLLELGEVYESAKVYVNGEQLAVLTGPVYQVVIPDSSLKEFNTLEILVSNLMANRVIGMEKRGERYQKFYNINFSARKRENLDENGIFTAKKWGPLKSGLIGPVIFKSLSIKDL